MLRASIEDGESDNEEYRKIRREIATSSDMTEQQLLQGLETSKASLARRRSSHATARADAEGARNDQ